ncbi:hypothetical protein SAMN02745857_03884 [Andreprevotia lacus DSM 23236]|jgi:hypothetical protein|uniref:Uncharacterized protein n=1 Tax=Andreprevotia lacus DSM 23236 TaxID=1121001 RepID=A0A1W1Y071_9NEIS|nr:hypothetical protein [Andreprevotia lacus]SMC29515.1 hypothetical protein SAMN02745857_03884 [Andreprevotia lacus DSM 23236]
MQTYKMTLQPGTTWVQPAVGKYFMLVECPQQVNVRLKLHGSAQYEATAVDTGFTSDDVEYDVVEIDAAVLCTVKIAVSNGKGSYNRLTGGSVALTGAVQVGTDTTITHVTPVTVGVAATAVVTADASRRGLRLYNASANTIYLGSSGVTVANAAMRIGPGGYVDETQVPGAAWFAIASAAGSELRVQEVR